LRDARKYPRPAARFARGADAGGENLARPLDDLDVQLLNVVQSNNHLTAEELAQQVPLSPSAIMRRLQKLKEEKVIAANVAVLAPERIGSHLSAIIRIQFERHAEIAVEQLRRSLVAAPQVQLCFYLSGAFDLMLLVVTRDMESFNDFVEATISENVAVRRYESEFVKRRWKSTLALPLSDPSWIS
jgi:Lrp/AsnC family leucine-responsive transcriptional regulator